MTTEIATRYLRFAQLEAAGQSLIYEHLATHVARSQLCLNFLSALPPDRQQPNLLFAAVRCVVGDITSSDALDIALSEHARAIAELMLSRTTQTNEPGRCAVLLPVLAQIDGPIALIEVGASAGLCLLPDLYSYDWGRYQLSPPQLDQVVAPTIACRVSQNTPLPWKYPDVVWRMGLDLNPLDVHNNADVTWLEHLVWPEHSMRLDRLRTAIAVAQSCPPRIVAGDLMRDLQGLIAEAPPYATVVVFHTAVLTYIADQTQRDTFARMMLESRAIWISNEGVSVFPQLAAGAGRLQENMFLLTRNGNPLAWTGPHGQKIDWLTTVPP
ncbi:DUF2332 domain-containing protein [Phaeobacter sp. C3_T13_0]|uniref:DUF2332 domain-containing protein n=1 Tax=Phaeobacter cretensis TaxID=3342641 RepID=UPI0039BD6373